MNKTVIEHKTTYGEISACMRAMQQAAQNFPMAVRIGAVFQFVSELRAQGISAELSEDAQPSEVT